MIKVSLALAASVLGLFLNSTIAQEVDNPDFSKGKTGWMGDGKVVYFAADGTISETAAAGAVPGLKIELSKNEWKEVHQNLRPKQKDTEIQYSVQVMADPTFVRLPESKDYSDVDFRQGSGYAWSALVYPKCDFLMRVHDDTWYYRPRSLTPLGTWKTFSESFPNLKARQREIALLFPPGEGTIYVKGK
ncbi:hypothetical protein DB345_12285 [Spartobacteria bacterium LR76]|nr:hypothetical protein DB345_12285 [Spartobacteria bacterium LR76]